MRKVAEFYKRLFLKFPNFMAPFPEPWKGIIQYKTEDENRIQTIEILPP